MLFLDGLVLLCCDYCACLGVFSGGFLIWFVDFAGCFVFVCLFALIVLYTFFAWFCCLAFVWFC